MGNTASKNVLSDVDEISRRLSKVMALQSNDEDDYVRKEEDISFLTRELRRRLGVGDGRAFLANSPDGAGLRDYNIRINKYNSLALGVDEEYYVHKPITQCLVCRQTKRKFRWSVDFLFACDSCTHHTWYCPKHDVLLSAPGPVDLPGKPYIRSLFCTCEFASLPTSTDSNHAVLERAHCFGCC